MENRISLSQSIPTEGNLILSIDDYFNQTLNPDSVFEHFGKQIAKINYNRFELGHHRLDIWLGDGFVALSQSESVYPFTGHLVFEGKSMSDCLYEMFIWLKQTLMFDDTTTEFAYNWMVNNNNNIDTTKRDIKDYLREMSEVKIDLMRKWSFECSR
jgi:hypothetical protein